MPISKTGPFSFSDFETEVMDGTDLKNKSWLAHPEVLQAANVATNTSMLALRDVIQGHRKTRPAPAPARNSYELELDKFSNPAGNISVEQGDASGGPQYGWMGKPDPQYKYCRTLGQHMASPSALNVNQHFRIYSTDKIKIRVLGLKDNTANTNYSLVINGYNGGFDTGSPMTFLNTTATNYLQQWEWFEMTPRMDYTYMTVSLQHFFGGGSPSSSESNSWGLEVRRA